MMTAVGHLANHGYVTVLHVSEGMESILLAPDLLANLASIMQTFLVFPSLINEKRPRDDNITPVETVNNNLSIKLNMRYLGN